MATLLLLGFCTNVDSLMITEAIDDGKRRKIVRLIAKAMNDGLYQGRRK
jgi:Fe2+ transport system protein B